MMTNKLDLRPGAAIAIEYADGDLADPDAQASRRGIGALLANADVGAWLLVRLVDAK